MSFGLGWKMVADAVVELLESSARNVELTGTLE